MPRLAATRSQLGDVLIYDRGAPASPGTGFTEATAPIRLHFDASRKDFAISQRYLPTVPGASGGVTLQEWFWANGTGGAGTTIETPTSAAAGASDFGAFVNLRRVGVAQPAGRLTEIALPAGTAAASGRFRVGRVFNGDLWISTLSRYLLRVAEATGVNGTFESDFGAAAATTGLAVWRYAGASDAHLYCGAGNAPLQEFDGAAWTAGEVETKRLFLETPYWTIGAGMASGGSAGEAGGSSSRLVGLHTQGLGFYHVDGDPKVAANWSSLIPVGTGGSFFPIQSLAADNRTVWFSSGVGVFGVDGLGYSPNFTKWVEQNADNTFTGYWCVYWANLLWFNTASGLAVFSPDGRRVDLARTFRFGGTTGVSEIYGFHQVMAPSEDGLYVGIFNPVTRDSYVGLLLLDANGAFRWSMAEAVLPGQNVTYLQQVTGTDGVPRLFIGTQDDTTGLMRLWVQDLPRSGDPEADYQSGGAFRPAAAWSIQLSRFNGAQPVRKTARRLMLEADQVGGAHPANTIAVSVSNDGGAFTAQGRATVSPRWSSQPIVGTAQATSMQVRLDVANGETAPVVIRSAAVLYSEHPEVSSAITLPVTIGEGSPVEDPRAMLQRLEVAQRAGPLYVDDFYGRRLEATVSIDQLEIVPEAVGNGWTIRAIVTLLVTRRVSRVDAGDATDQGYPAS